MTRMSFHKSILAWFSLAFIILLIVSYSSYVSFKKTSYEQEWVEHSYSVIDNVNAVLTNLLDAQSSQRGYILTGQEENLARYSLALPEIDLRLKNLEKLVADNPEQTERLSRISTAKADRTSISAGSSTSRPSSRLTTEQCSTSASGSSRDTSGNPAPRSHLLIVRSEI